MQKILIYSENNSARFRYITRHILEEVLGFKTELTNQAFFFTSFEGPRINYSQNDYPGSLQIRPCGLLSATGHAVVDTGKGQLGAMPLFFRTVREDAVPFDLLAASFYLLSRYEEYLPFRADRHGRFEASESLAYREGFLHRPLVNEWIFFLRDRLLERWPALKARKPHYRFQPTIDIDQAWAYQYKTGKRMLGGAARDMLQLRLAALNTRYRVLKGLEQDPFDNFEWINEVHESCGLVPLWFFLSGAYGEFDKNMPVTHPGMRKLILVCARHGEIGIHPSYDSHGEELRLREEKEELSKVSGMTITKSRQHYLRLRLPDSYQLLEQIGISDDYSMGYASQPGFRASTCTPFRFYNLAAEKETALRLHPFAAMERTYSDYLHVRPEAALESILSLASEAKKYGGEFITIFHNETLAESKKPGWREVYRDMLHALTRN